MNIKKHCAVGVEETSDTFAHKLSEKHIRVAVIGNVDAGKRSVIISLSSGSLMRTVLEGTPVCYGKHMYAYLN